MPPFIHTRGNKSVYLTPDPHYIPKYCGHMPGANFRISERFSKITNDLFRDPFNTTSGNTILSHLYPDNIEDNRGHTDPAGGRNVPKRMGEIYRDWGQIPGYTGFIPRNIDQVGLTFRQAASHAINKFKTDLCHTRQREAGSMLRAVMQSDEIVNKGGGHYTLPEMMPRYRTALMKEAPDMTTYETPEIRLHGKSPYAMANDDPNKYFNPGYTGVVPRLEHQLGRSYGQSSSNALKNFANEMEKNEICKTMPYFTVLPPLEEHR